MGLYNILLTVNYIGIFIIFCEIVFVLRQNQTKMQQILLLNCLAVFLDTFGYTFEMQATSLEMAMFATKIQYLGKVFTPFTMFLFIANYCNISISKKLINGLFAFHCFIILLVNTCAYHNLFYTTISFVDTEGLFPHLELGYGLFYYLNYGLNFLYLFAMIYICYKKYKTTLHQKERQQIFNLLSIVVVMIIGVGVYYSGVTKGYDTTILSFVISSCILFRSMLVENLFDTLELAKDFVMDHLEEGVIVLDPEGTLLYINEVAEGIYPDFKSGDYEFAAEELLKYRNKNGNYISDNMVCYVYSRDVIVSEQARAIVFVFSDITDSYNYTNRLKEEVQDQKDQLDNIQHQIIASFANMVEARDDITGVHIKRTSDLVKILVDAMMEEEKYQKALTRHEAEIIIEAAPLHDIGKIAIPDHILTKPGKLTDEEFAIIKTHAAKGAEVIEKNLKGLEADDYVTIAMNVAHYHHEKWDGSGYPNGLKGEEIPFSARVMAIADVYDALRSKRTYKDAFSQSKAVQILQESSGSHFDPDLIRIFMEHLDQISAMEKQYACQ
ncbi:MAG: HD domain-containing protein [Lachnospiraceae bacterium]|nr:HD domain-containing protein [Lachnospiraceae bacterium]